MKIRLYCLFFICQAGAFTYCQVNDNTASCHTGLSQFQILSDRNKIIADSLVSNTYSRLVNLANYDSLAIQRFDKILTYDHQVYLVKIQNITPSHVLYLYPFNTDVHALNRNEISQIQYADGTIDVFLPLPDKSGFSHHIVDTSRIIIRNAREWEKVALTENSADIDGMIEKGKITACYQADFVNAANEYLEKNACIILKKKAANLNAPIILVTNKNYIKSYGDLPSIELEGIIYNYE